MHESEVEVTNLQSNKLKFDKGSSQNDMEDYCNDPEFLLAMQLDQQININKEPEKPVEKKKRTQRKPNRCDVDDCRKKLKITDQAIGKCRCERIFCSKHRHFESHDCDFDFMEHGKDILAKSNKKVVNDKLENRI